MNTYLWLMFQDNKEYEVCIDERTANRLSYELDSWMRSKSNPSIKFNTEDGSLHTVYLEGLRIYRLSDNSLVFPKTETSVSDNEQNVKLKRIIEEIFVIAASSNDYSTEMERIWRIVGWVCGKVDPKDQSKWGNLNLWKPERHSFEKFIEELKI